MTWELLKTFTRELLEKFLSSDSVIFFIRIKKQHNVKLILLVFAAVVSILMSCKKNDVLNPIFFIVNGVKSAGFAIWQKMKMLLAFYKAKAIFTYKLSFKKVA